MQIEPFQNVPQGTFREISVHDTTLYLDRDLVLSVNCMKMRRRMFAREHADHDPQETR